MNSADRRATTSVVLQKGVSGSSRLRRFRSKYCQWKWEGFMEEAKIPYEEVAQKKKEIEDWYDKEHAILQSKYSKDEKGHIPTYDQETGKSSEYWTLQHNLRQQVWDMQSKVPNYRLGDQEFTIESGMWLSLKKFCLCDEDMECPTIVEAMKNEEEWEHRTIRTFGISKGLHMFEIKSDKDNHDRLEHQILQMIGIADYAWLVLGANQSIPEWLPPYIGILRHEPESKDFLLEKTANYLDHHPTLHRHVLEDNEVSVVRELNAHIRDLLKKWTINSIFRWENERGMVIDMTEALKQISKDVKRLNLRADQFPLAQYETKKVDDES